jgi:uncharacterized protein HemY
MRDRLLKLLFLLAAALLATPAYAAPGGDGYTPYVPTTEQVSAPLFVIVAYSIIWLTLLLFVVSLWVRQRRVAVDIEQLRRQLEEEVPDGR